MSKIWKMYTHTHTHTHTHGIFSHKEENPAICGNIGEYWEHYAKWNKSEKDKYYMMSFTRGI